MSTECLREKEEVAVDALEQMVQEHALWANPLLHACERGELTREDFQFLFAQYYFYSKNFTKLLGAALVHCESDSARAQLSENLWEEGGEGEDKERHAEIFRRFLSKGLGVEINQIEFTSSAWHFFEQYLSLCLSRSPEEAFAVLSFATEAIVADLYATFRKGLLAAGVAKEDLLFFDLHIECDDDHALVLKNIALSYAKEPGWFERCRMSVQQALDLRDRFFRDLYTQIQQSRLRSLLGSIEQSKGNTEMEEALPSLGIEQFSTSTKDTVLYSNKGEGVDFSVFRMPFLANEVLDPRILEIPVDGCNERHAHAHETVFLILEGQGVVDIGEMSTDVLAGDVILVPRWQEHQTRNTGKTVLRVFAVTDFGLTRLFSGNTDQSYRQKQAVL